MDKMIVKILLRMKKERGWTSIVGSEWDSWAAQRPAEQPAPQPECSEALDGFRPLPALSIILRQFVWSQSSLISWGINAYCEALTHSDLIQTLRTFLLVSDAERKAREEEETSWRAEPSVRALQLKTSSARAGPERATWASG